jgi:hypothetical protein
MGLMLSFLHVACDRLHQSLPRLRKMTQFHAASRIHHHAAIQTEGYNTTLPHFYRGPKLHHVELHTQWRSYSVSVGWATMEKKSTVGRYSAGTVLLQC